MIKEYQLRLLPRQAANESALKDYLAHEEGLSLSSITHVRVLKRSIDARQRTIFVNLKVRVYVNEQPTDDDFQRTVYPDVSGRPSVVVVGAGPGGLFAALRLIELGYRPIVVERGKNVRDRKHDLALITKTQQVDAESNYCFGEGGAGAYSDGKLYTRSKKRGNTEKILNVFCQHGASTNILADAHPHIGTDRLPRVIENMRNTIINSGGEVHFQTRMTRLIIEKDKVIGIEAEANNSLPIGRAGGGSFSGPVILATGHSARRRQARAPQPAHRPDTVSQPSGARRVAPGSRVFVCHAGRRPRRLFLLHVSRRLRHSRCHRSRADCRQRHVAGQSRNGLE